LRKAEKICLRHTVKEEATLITEISPEVRSFLKEHVHSVWQLELILHMRERKESRTVAEIAKHLYSTPAAIESTLERFVNLGILKHALESQNSYVFAPASAEMQRTIDDSVKTYSARRIDVINLIFSNPQKAPRLTLE
jgi:predicted HTH transcriptional regulator